MFTHIGLNQDDLKRSNRSQILSTILERAVISRKDIAAHTGLTPPSVSNIVAELIECGLVEEIGSDLSPNSRRGGPNPILLSITSEKPYIMAFHLGPATLEAGAVNLQGKVVAHSSVPLPEGCTAPALWSAVTELASGLCREQDLNMKQDILAIGFATAGNLAEDGSVAWHRHIPFQGLPIKARLQNLFGLPAFVGNTARSMALAEGWFGKGRSYSNYLFVLVWDTVDAAIVVNRGVVVGRRYFSSLLGHHQVDSDGPLCSCGQKGCVDVMASDAALLRRAEQLAGKNGWLLAHLTAGKPLSKQLIAEAADRGDEESRQLLAQRGAYIGKAIAEALNWIDVEGVVVAKDLASGPSEAETNAIEMAYLDNLSFRNMAPELVFSEMKSELALVGPATLAIRWVVSPQFDLSAYAEKFASALRKEA